MVDPDGAVVVGAGAIVVGLAGGAVVVDAGVVLLAVVDGATDVVVVVLAGGAVVDDVVPDVVVVVVVGATPVSGLVQLAGGVAAPCWPGISTVPAQPKLEKVVASTRVPPSANVATESVDWM